MLGRNLAGAACRLPLVYLVEDETPRIEIVVHGCTCSVFHLYLPHSDERIYKVAISSPDEVSTIAAHRHFSTSFGAANYRGYRSAEVQEELSDHFWTASCTCRPQTRFHRKMGDICIGDIWATYHLAPKQITLAERMLCFCEVDVPSEVLWRHVSEECQQNEFQLCQLAVQMVMAEYRKMCDES